MSDENIANREYSANTDELGTSMPGSRIAGNGEMGGSMDVDPVFDAGKAGTTGNDADDQGNVTGAGTGQMIDVDDQDDQDIGGGTTGTGVGGYGAGYGGGINGADTDGASKYGI